MCVGGRGTGGNGRGLEEGYATRPHNIPIIPPHTVFFTMVWGGGGLGRVRGRGTVLFGAKGLTSGTILEKSVANLSDKPLFMDAFILTILVKPSFVK